MGLFWSWSGLPLGWLVAAAFLLTNFLLLINNKRHGILGLGKAVLSNALLYLWVQMKVLWVCHGLSSVLHETGDFLMEVARIQRGRGGGSPEGLCGQRWLYWYGNMRFDRVRKLVGLQGQISRGSARGKEAILPGKLQGLDQAATRSPNWLEGFIYTQSGL